VLRATENQQYGKIFSCHGKLYVKGMGNNDETGFIPSDKFWEAEPYIASLEKAYFDLTTSNDTLRKHIIKTINYSFWDHIKVAFSKLFSRKGK